MSLNEDMKDVLECPACLTFPRSGPIYQCSRGHIVCNNCRKNIIICPQCRETLGHSVRNLVAEKMRDKVCIPCKFEGCKVEMMRQPLEQHERTCAYREVLCPGSKCSKMIPLPKLVDHVSKIEDHSLEDFLLSSFSSSLLSFPNSILRVSLVVYEFVFNEEVVHDWECSRMFYNRAHFFCRQRRNVQGLWFIWLYMKEDEYARINDYMCTFSIKRKDEDGFESEITSRCRPISLDICPDRVEKSKNCLVFTDDIAKQYLIKNKDLNVDLIKFVVNVEEVDLSASDSKKRKMYE